ncbi:hypothetical protein [Leifsonia sp. Leaf264]|nr:hypothetical protein [Leifsonia sp. Leaf264]
MTMKRPPDGYITLSSAAFEAQRLWTEADLAQLAAAGHLPTLRLDDAEPS